MKNWKPIVGGCLAALALSVVGGSSFASPKWHSGSADQVVFAAVTFLSVLVLQWLLWRFIVPSASAVPGGVTSFFYPLARRSFFAGIIGLGYLHVALHCVVLAGYLEQFAPRLHIGYLGVGLLQIGLGTAARLRDVFLTLSSRPAAEAAR